MHKGVFITGTDTEVGKTYIGSALAKRLYQQGHNVQPRKPAESACSENEQGILIPADGMQYYNAVSQSVSLDIITPYRFRAVTSTRQAAKLEQQTLTMQQLQNAVLQNNNSNDFLLVEGAGGFYSPLSEDGLNADLAQSLGLPVILVAADRLGCLNHSLLTMESIRRRKLKPVCIVMNALEEHKDDMMHNLAELRSYTNTPVYYANHNAQESDPEFAKQLDSIIDLIV